ncbi:MAG: hypothetical protein FWJ64_09820 [Limnochordia bacterium]
MSAMVWLLTASLAVLLVSNLWLLREVERLSARFEACQKEVLALEARVVRLTALVDLLHHPPTDPDGAAGAG